MNVLAFLNRHGLWISWPFVGVGGLLLAFSILAAVRVGGTSRICDLPLVTQQTVEFPEPGKVVLWLEGPRATSRFAGVSFELIGEAGTPLKGRIAAMRQRSSGISTVRLADRVFTIPSSGEYILNANALGDANPDDALHRLIFTQPHLLKTLGYVVGIVLGALLCIGGLVNFFIRLAQGRSS